MKRSNDLMDNAEEEGISATKKLRPALPGVFSEKIKTDKLFESSIDGMITVFRDQMKRKNEISEISKNLEQTMTVLQHEFFEGDHASAKEHFNAISTDILRSFVPVLEAAPLWLRHGGSVVSVMEKFAALGILFEFFESGNFMFPNAFRERYSFTDEEYVRGLISAARCLPRYAVGRATEGDERSIILCRDAVRDLLTELLEFDFRNGPLRRAYDGVKYTFRKLEDMLYEISLTRDSDVEERSPLSKDESSGTVALVNVSELRSISQRMADYDAKRELVIKKSRDIQKSGKKAVFALHRGDMKKTGSLLDGAISTAKQIVDEHLASEPRLRAGTFANAIEEWAEARLYQHWLPWAVATNDADVPHFPLLAYAKMRDEISITEEEYLGGLVDLTGEIGRWAVAQAAKRDVRSVRRALATCRSVRAAILKMGNASPLRVRKKGGDLDRNIGKLENILYELSLLQKSGRRTMRQGGVSERCKRAVSAKDNDDDGR